ncbi:MAG TPA: SUMF1/EgtB/PvdO family nonheme iron enzyme [Saprospiraceae bacterium]|nr:SUMF1/EgtB/PvdO family nonheme iron enzyme [Saprospiraceae bacterium]
MPLTQPLAEFRRQLEAQLRDTDLPGALNGLLVHLPEGSEKYRIVSALIARLNAANKERFRNTISPEEYRRLVDQVSADFFDLLGALTEADFEITANKPATGKAAKRGSVLYRVPHVMPVHKPTRCTIRVAVDEDAILENIVLDEHVQVRSHVEISDVMSAELLDPEGGTFQINALNSRTQLVRETGFTEWNFSVTPLLEGVHQLLVKVSILEKVEGFAEPIPREVSLMETVTIVTEAPAPQETEFKPSGQTFAFQSSSTAQNEIKVKYAPSEPVEAPERTGNSRLKPLAFFLAFIILAPSATWALTPPATRDWWVASVKDTAEAYAAYIEEYAPKGSPHLEKAYFYKAEETGRLADLREYQRQYRQGKYETRVAERISTLETGSLASLRSDPDRVKIRQFVADFPESERLSELKAAVQNRAELLPEVESAYVASIQSQPTERKVQAYLRDFPRQERLGEVAEAAASNPEVLQKTQPILDGAILKKMESAGSAEEVQRLLPVLEKAGSPAAAEKLQKIMQQKPAQMRNSVQGRVQKAVEEVRLREVSGRKLKSLSGVSGDGTADPGEKDVVSGDRMAALSEKDLVSGDRAAVPSDGVTRSHPVATPGGSVPSRQEARTRRSGIYDVVRVEGGTFTMGSPEREEGRGNDECQHSVTVRTFSIGKYEVTQADWREIMGGDPPQLEFKGCDDCPVENVSWNDVKGFLKKLNAKFPGKNYRLPSEQEWEYAARGGNKNQGYRYSGSNDLKKVGWYVDNAGSKSHRVGDLAANELGIYDMSGNVYEWCQDEYDQYPGCSIAFEAYSSQYVFRGGSWSYFARHCRTALRGKAKPGYRVFNLGFRLAHSPQ